MTQQDSQITEDDVSHSRNRVAASVSNRSLGLDDIEQGQYHSPAFILALDAMVVTSDQGYCVAANPAAGDLFGVPPEAIVGRSVLDLFPPKAVNPANWVSLPALSQRRGKTTIQRADGARRQVEFTVTAQGAAHRHWLILRDITDRQQAEAQYQQLAQDLEQRALDRAQELAITRSQLEQQQQRLDSILNSVEGVVWSIHPITHQVLYSNDATEHIYGYPAAAFRADPNLWLTLIHPADQPQVQQAIQHLPQTGTASLEYRIRLADGQTRWLRHTMCLVYTPEGQALRIDGTITNISKFKALEADLRASAAKNRAILDQAAIGVNQASPEGQFLRVNQAFCRMLGYSEAELLSLGFQDVTWAEDLPASNEVLQALYRREMTSATLDKRYIRKDGTVFWGRAVLSVLWDQQGQPIADIALIQDISEQKQQETERQAAEQALAASEHRHRVLVNAIPDLVFRINQQGTYLDYHAANPTLIYGPIDQIVGYTLDEMFPPPIADMFRGHINRTLATQTLQEFQYTLPIDGKEVVFEGRMVPSAADEVTYIVRDITARKATEQALEDSEATKRAMLEAIPDLIMRVNRQGVGLDVISGGEVKLLPNTFGCDSRSMYDILPLPQAQKRMDYVQRALDTGKYQQYEQVLEVSGELRYEENRIVPLTQDEVLILVRDITDRVKAEAALWESEQRFQAIFHQMYQFIGLLSPDGTLLEANQTSLTFIGATREQVINRPYWQTPWWRDHQAAQQQLQAAIAAAAQGEFIRYEVEIKGQANQVITIDFSLRPVFGPTGEVTLLIPEGRDLSDRKQIERELRRTKEFLEQTNRVARVGGWALDLVTQQLTWTGITRDIHEVGPDFEPTLDQAIAFYKPGPSRDTVSQVVDRCIATGQPWDITVELITANSCTRWVRTQGQGEFDGQTCLRLYGSIQDIDAQVRAEQALAASEERLQLALRAANDGWWDWDVQQGTIYYSPRWFTMLGYSPSELPQQPELWRQLLHPDDTARIEKTMSEALSSHQEVFTVESRLQHKQGHYVPVLTRGLIVRDQDQQPVRVSAVNADLTYQKQAEARQAELHRQLRQVNAELSRQATIDSLTQIANRRQFDQVLGKVWRRSQLKQTPVSLILADIDFFKPYNDNYGHPQGDRCLCQVAEAISEAVRHDKDLVARYGGEEFAILLPETDAPGAIQVAQRIRDNIADLGIPHDFSQVSPHITISMGVGCYSPQTTDQPYGFISRVDAALYQAKHLGRDRFCLTD
ncbi:PAS domain S-box protein [Nodosilinea sp. P-1105]|uniref:PAS domain S-box protein n=1 Tax=Nodosilinea sp. P-1105 TaxID=2546229 RepID=UPI00146DEBEB|nr:PAS domain S-box protein [Nodosilinea sp. P-1105]NMF82813.1 PAS domain S-box protein [Nodosilinea sp. P-1105]